MNRDDFEFVIAFTSGPPGPPPNFRHYGSGRRRGGGFWSRFAEQSLGWKINIIGSALGLLLLIGYSV